MKKTISIILCLSIVLTMSLSFSVTVSADYLSIESDNFENSGVIKNDSGYEYISNNGLLVHSKGFGSNTNSNHVSLATGEGYGGTTALYLHTDASKMSSNTIWRPARMKMKEVVIGENETVLVRYKVKVKQIGASFVAMPAITGKSSEGTAASKAIATGYSTTRFNPDKWYTIVAKISGTTATKSVDSYAVCEDGTLFSMTKDSDSQITIGVDTTKYSAATQPINIWPVSIPEAAGVTEAHKSLIYVDDVYLAKYSTLASQNISLDAAASTISDGAKDVLLSPTFRLTFDHDLADKAADSVKLYKKTDTTKQSPIACNISAKTFDGLTLTPADKLALNEDYVIDISGISGKQGQTLKDTEKTISFSTIEALPADPVVFTGAAATKGGAFTEGNLTNVALDDSFTLTFDKPLSQPDTSKDILLYKSADANKIPVTISAALSSDKKSVTVTPSAALSLNTAYTLSFEGVKTEEGGVLSGTKEVTFSTVITRNAIVFVENLDNAIGLPSAYENDVLRETTGKFAFDSTGYGGTTGLRFNNVGSSTNTNAMSTKAYDLDENEKIAVEFKLNVKSYTDEATNFGMPMGIVNEGTISQGPVYNSTIFGLYNGTSGPYIGPSTNSKTLTLDPDVFYTVVIVSTRTNQTGYIYDEEGTLVFTRSITLTRPITSKARFVCMTADSSYKVRADMTFDDFGVYRIHNHTLDIDSVRSTVNNGDSGVNVSGAITLAFNQPLTEGAADKVELYLGTEKVNTKVEHKGGSEIIITPITTLNPGRTYNIKIDNPASLFGKAYDGPSEISFTTKTIYNINALETSLAIGNDATVSAGQKTLTLDNIGSAVDDAVLVVAIYSNSRPARLIGWEKFDIEKLNANENTVTFSLSQDYAGAYSAEILLYNSISSLKPLMKAYKITK